MKKSCSAQESKVVTAQNTENNINVSDDSKEQLTEEQLLINQKLLESGISDEGLGWLEKRNIFKTINVSLDTAVSEKLQRSSPRLVKVRNANPAKWIENSFENVKHDERNSKTKSVKNDSECISSQKPNFLSSKKRPNQDTQENILRHNNPVEISSCENLKKDSEINNDFPNCLKKIHLTKAQVDENSKEECDVLEAKNQSVNPAKKRASQPEVYSVEAPKKFKMEETSNGVSSEEETSSKIELETEKIKCSETYKLKDIKSIVSEYEIRNKKWKETFSKYKCPARWGMPIVRNCSEKWDGKQIPPKLLQRYQRYLSSKNLTHPIFFPVKSQTNNLIKISEINSPSTCDNSECINETDTNFKNLGEGSYAQEDSDTIGLENNLNVSTSVKDSTGRMVLRNRTQQKTIISDDEEFSSDESDDWMDKQKSSKKQKTNVKSKKAPEQSNKQLVLKLERCDINKEEKNEVGNKDASKNNANFARSSNLTYPAGNLKSVPDPDTMICPICSLRFKKQHIESHATECASKTYKD